jgi:hypothetical protein
VDTPLGVSYIKTVGNINFKQKSRVNSASVTTNELPSNLNVINNATVPFDINDLKYSYSLRNYTTTYDYTSEIIPFVSSKEIEIVVEINIPTNQKVLFQSPYLYQFKIAWIQYFSIFVPIAIFVYLLMLFTFKLGILETKIYKNN